MLRIRTIWSYLLWKFARPRCEARSYFVAGGLIISAPLSPGCGKRATSCTRVLGVLVVPLCMQHAESIADVRWRIVGDSSIRVAA